MRFKIGDKVKLNYEIKSFKYGRGGVDYNEIGTISYIYDTDIQVDFPSCKLWNGLEKELILISKESRTFFKKLPNNYTGIIEVENGYIVEKEILDEEEKKYLSDVIRPFRGRVKCIIKRVFCKQGDYIEIALKNEPSVSLPFFKKNTMYKGMEAYKKYTLKELGLDE